jgi:hypothetical protein
MKGLNVNTEPTDRNVSIPRMQCHVFMHIKVLELLPSLLYTAGVCIYTFDNKQCETDSQLQLDVTDNLR